MITQGSKTSIEICYTKIKRRRVSEYSCILVLNITKAGFQHKPRIFFLFCDLVFIDFLNFLAVFTKILAQKTWIPWVVFMILNKKKVYTSRETGWALGPPLRPPLRASRSAPASAPALGPSRSPERYQLIFLLSIMKPPMVSSFCAKNFCETAKKFKKNQWNQVTKKKKCAVSL